MSIAKEARELIKILEANQFYAECPCCNEQVKLKDAGLFYLDDFTKEAEDLYKQRLLELREREKELRERRKSIPRVSETTTRAVNIGFILERLIPSMKDFDYERNDCRSLFDPIDYIIFEGLYKNGTVNRIIFADIKTGTAPLKKKQKEIRKLVERKQVIWDTYKAEETR